MDDQSSIFEKYASQAKHSQYKPYILTGEGDSIHSRGYYFINKSVQKTLKVFIKGETKEI